MAISKGLLAVLLAAGAFLAGLALCFCGLQTAMIRSGTGENMYTRGGLASCDPPGLRLPVSLPAMIGIDAAVVVAVSAAWDRVGSLIDATAPFTRRRRLVRNLATSAFLIGVLVAFSALPTCPAAVAGAWGANPNDCGDCFPFARATLRRVNAVALAVLAVLCVSIYIILNYMNMNPAGNGEASDGGGAPRWLRRRDLRE